MPTLTLDIVTPEARIFSGPVLSVTLPGAEGEFCVLPMHNPTLTRLVPGELGYLTDQGAQTLAIGEGFVEVTAKNVRVLTDLAVGEKEIDEKIVQEALDRAQEALRSQTLIGEELEATEVAIARCSAQLKFKNKYRSFGGSTTRE